MHNHPGAQFKLVVFTLIAILFFTDNSLHAASNLEIEMVKITVNIESDESTQENIEPDNNIVNDLKMIIQKSYEIGRYEITKSQYNLFVKESGHEADGCNYWDFRKDDWVESREHSWENPGFLAEKDARAHPVVCVSFNDAQAFIKWLNTREDSNYRLPSDAEWEYAARSGKTERYFWGEDEKDACEYANSADEAFYDEGIKKLRGGEQPRFETISCDDGHAWTAPVGSYKANAFEIHDMVGNVWEWTSGSFPTGEVAAEEGVYRSGGGSWSSSSQELHLARRPKIIQGPNERYSDTGFRVARSIVGLQTKTTTAAPKPPSARPDLPQLHVLTIGVSEYKNHDHLLLNYADDDAKDIANVLIQQEDGSIYARVNPLPLINEQATRSEVYKAVENFRRNMKPGREDVVVILFSGHGAEIEGKYYLLPYDVLANSNGEIKGTGIEIEELVEELRKMGEQGKVLVFLDACHSGELVENSKSLVPDMEELRNELAEAGNGVVVFTSSRGRELSREDPKWENGAFTEAVLEALKGKPNTEGTGNTNGDKWLTLSELKDYIPVKVRELTNNRQHSLASGAHFPARLFELFE